MDTSAVLRTTADMVRKRQNMEDKLRLLQTCFHDGSGMRTIGFQPRRYFGCSVPSQATLETLHGMIDTETEVVEIGSCLGLYGFVFGNPLFCKRWVSTDHPDTYQQWIPSGNQKPFSPVFLTKDPLLFFSPSTPFEKRVLITVWPEAESSYFWDDYVQYFEGNTVIIIGTPGKREMWTRLSESALHCTATTVCRIDLGFAFDYETIFVWQKESERSPALNLSRSSLDVPSRGAELADRDAHAREGPRMAGCACVGGAGAQGCGKEAGVAHDAGHGRISA